MGHVVRGQRDGRTIGTRFIGIVSDVSFEAGHTYKLCADRTTGHGYRVYHWIEDRTAGRIVYGEKKP